MRKLWKKLLSLALAVCMVATMLPTAALASSNDGHPTLKQLNAIGYSFVERGYRLNFNSASTGDNPKGSLNFNMGLSSAEEITAAVPIRYVNRFMLKGTKSCLFFTTAQSDPQAFALESSHSGNPGFDQCYVQGWSTDSLTIVIPQSVNDLHIDSKGRIYLNYNDHKSNSKTYYLGANGFTDNSADAAPAPSAVSFTVSAGLGGTVSVTGATNAGGNTYTADKGASVTLTATPNLDYLFSAWSGSSTAATNSLTISAAAGASYTANFTCTVWHVNLTNNPSTSHITTVGDLTQKVTKGQPISPITLTANPGYDLPLDNAINILLAGTSLSCQNGVISGTPTKEVSFTLPTATLREYGVTKPVAHRLTVSGSDKANELADYTVTYAAKDGFTLPAIASAFTVTVGGTALSTGDFTYDPATGRLTVKKEKIRGALTITVDESQCAPVVSAGVNSLGEGYVKVDKPAENTRYAAVDSNGSVITGTKAYDKNGKELTADEKGWIACAPENGPVIFRPIQAATSAKVVAAPADKAAQTTPSDYLATGSAQGGPVVPGPATVPAIGGNVFGGVDADPVHTDKTTVTVEPADPALKYALLDADGNLVEGKGWTAPTTDGKVIFDDLAPGVKYQVVAKPATEGSDEITEADKKTAVPVTPPRGRHPRGAAQGLTGGRDQRNEQDRFEPHNPGAGICRGG